MTSPALPFVLLGAGGHARVLLALLRACGHAVLGVSDPRLAAEGTVQWEGLAVLGDDAALAERLPPGEVQLALGVGQVTAGNLRERLHAAWSQRGYALPALVHPAAWLAPDVRLAQGVQVMAGAIIQPGCEIGENSVINTRAGIDHDCSIGRDVHVAPGATLCGAVHVGTGAFIGSGAVVIQGVQVGERSIVGAGAVLVRDLAPRHTLLGSTQRVRPDTPHRQPGPSTELVRR